MPSPESNRKNGLLGGRPKGSTSMSRDIFKARKAIEQRKLTLAQRCQEHEQEYIAILEDIAANEKEPASARISAISLILDRGRGKAVQPEHHSGEVTLTVTTGVPRADEEPHSPGVWHKPPEPQPLFQRPAETGDKRTYPLIENDTGVVAGAEPNSASNANDSNEAIGIHHHHQCSSQRSKDPPHPRGISEAPPNWSTDDRSVHDVTEPAEKPVNPKVSWHRY